MAARKFKATPRVAGFGLYQTLASWKESQMGLLSSQFESSATMISKRMQRLLQGTAKGFLQKA